jgi:hypothetical protein
LFEDAAPQKQAPSWGLIERKIMNYVPLKQKEELRRKINRLFLLPPGRPTDDELTNILNKYENLPFYNRDESNLSSIVNGAVPHEGMYLTEGLDTSDVNNVLDQLNGLLTK